MKMIIDKIRRWLHIDWLCIGCDKLGSLRWLDRHDCPERDAFQERVKRDFEKYYLRK